MKALPFGDARQPDVRFVRNRAGLSIAYNVFGRGAPEMVWVPNFTSHVDAWRISDASATFVTALSKVGRLLQFDQPGTGASDPVAPDALPSMEQWMERAPDYPWGFPPELREKGMARWKQIWGTGRQLEMTAPGFAGDTDLVRRWGMIERISASPSMANALFRMISEIDVRDVLPAVHVPVLVLHRRDDPWIRVEHGRYLAEHIAGARFVEMPGNAHYSYVLGDVDEVVRHVTEFVTGAPRAPEDMDRVLTTLLFTDIVGSTNRAVELGDKAWRGLLDRHDALVSELVARFRGRVVKSTGDGSLATFDGPARAVRCAAAIREATRPLGLAIRAGLHTGEVELRGQDVGGVAVHVAARVEALAEPGEVLVSQTVKDLTIGSGIDFIERGEHELKGMPGAWRVYAAQM